jgi:hypothetical protein
MSEPGWPFGGRPKAIQAWCLWKAGSLQSCEINQHPMGFEVRYYQGTDFVSARIHGTLAAANEDAADRKAELLRELWTETPPMPG